MTEWRVLVAYAVLFSGICYGAVAFVVGALASFTLNGKDFVESWVALLMGFIAILPIAITAIWRPRTSAVLMAVCFVGVECSGFANDGFRGLRLVAERIALPDILIIGGFAFVAYANIWKRSNS